MRHGNGDKIIISREDDGHYVYWSVRDDSDNGTIIDFVKYRQNSRNLSPNPQRVANMDRLDGSGSARKPSATSENSQGPPAHPEPL